MSGAHWWTVAVRPTIESDFGDQLLVAEMLVERLGDEGVPVALEIDGPSSVRLVVAVEANNWADALQRAAAVLEDGEAHGWASDLRRAAAAFEDGER